MQISEEVRLLRAEGARRELARRSYAAYLSYVNPGWVDTRMSRFISGEVQQFLEEDTGHAYDILVVETPPQHGKLAADSTPVPTPSGWKRHGDIKPGDYVFSPAGKPIRVLAEIPQTEPASMCVTFTDGAAIRVHPNHEWAVYDQHSKRNGYTVLETKELLRRGLRLGPKGRGGRYRFSVDRNVCVEYADADLGLHPYFLGLWLGDGSTTKPCITHSPSDVEPIQKVEGLGYTVSSDCVHSQTGVRTTYFSGECSAKLRELGFGTIHSAAKHIPDKYKQSSMEQRLELLAGMIDSDGYVYQNNGRVTISNTNRALIDDFAEVVRSLGWAATVSAADPATSSSGIVGKKVCYQLTFNPDMVIPTALPRKAILRITPKRRRRGIVSITPCEPEHGKCLTVEGGVYLIGDRFTPTHNSMTISEALPSWVLGRHPTWRVIEASYNDETAERFCRRNKEKLTKYGAILFDARIGAINRATEFELENGQGRMISRGVTSGITGNPANLLIIDDPIKNRIEADSTTLRGRVWDEWQNSLKSRLAAGAKVILIMTPWHEDDIAARILTTERNVRLLRLPVEAEADDPLGREAGEALCPELGKGAAWLADFKPAYIRDPGGGVRAWAALYQCSPRVEGGNVIHRDWWRYYNTAEIRAFATTVVSVDATFKGGDKNDFVAIEVWSKLNGDYYCRYCLNQHLDFPGTIQAIRTVKSLFPEAMAVLIEDKANGSAAVSVLQHEMFCIPVNPKGGKVARVNAIAPAVESGHVLLPVGAPWVSEFVDQFSAFPAGKHDDMCDAASQALAYLIFSSGALGATEPTETELLVESEEACFLDPDRLFDVYSAPADNLTTRRYRAG